MASDISNSRPVPDPTTLTTQQLLREISALREIIDARLDGSDKVTEILKEHLDQRGTAINAEVAHLQKLHEEKFRSIAVQFSERDTRTEQTSKDSKVAVDAALQAAKEAVGEQNKSSALAIAKSEAATTKQIDQIGQIIATTAKGVDDKIDDIKTRITAIESRAAGSDKTNDRSSSIISLLIAGSIAIVVVGGGLVSLIAFIVTRHA